MKQIYLNLFNTIDDNNDGVITRKELATAIKTHPAVKAFLGQPAAPKLTRSATGVVQVQFVTLQDQLDRFSDLDLNGDGVISWEEFEGAMSGSGDNAEREGLEQLTFAEALQVMEQLFKDCDINHDGMLTVGE